MLFFNHFEGHFPGRNENIFPEEPLLYSFSTLFTDSDPGLPPKTNRIAEGQNATLKRSLHTNHSEMKFHSIIITSISSSTYDDSKKYLDFPIIDQK